MSGSNIIENQPQHKIQIEAILPKMSISKDAIKIYQQALINKPFYIATDGSENNNTSAYAFITYDEKPDTTHKFGTKCPDIYAKEASLYSELFGILAAITFSKYIESNAPTKQHTQVYIYADNEEAISRAQDPNRIHHHSKFYEITKEINGINNTLQTKII